MVKLEVYVSRGCPNCEYARQMAAQATQAYPQVDVQVLELGQVDAPPEDVYATPTYRLNDRVISLGNPDWLQLSAALEAALGKPLP